MTTFEYAPALESRSIVTIKPEYGHFINGTFLNGKNHFTTINPSNEEILSQIALGNADDIERAVDAARVA
jgi:aldehyde dehydrogenase (NAD+)